MDRAQAFGNPAPRHREHLTFATPWPKQRFEGFVVLDTTPPKQVQDMFIRGVHMLGDSGEPWAIHDATRVAVSIGNTFAALPFNPLSICGTKKEVERRMALPEMWKITEAPKKPFPEPKTWKNSITITSPTGETSRAERLYRDGSFGLTISDPSIAAIPMVVPSPPPPEPEPTWLEEDLVPPITSQEYMEKFNKKR